MTEPHRATPEQWAQIERSAEEVHGDGCSAILELRARVEALEAAQLEQAESGRFCTDAIVRRVEALEAAQHAHADVSHLSDAEREQAAQDLASPAAWRPLDIETTYVTNGVYTNAAQILRASMVVEGTFKHGGETYRYKANATPERDPAMTELRARVEALEQRLTPPMAEAAADPAPASEPPPQIASSQELYQIWDSSTNVSSALRVVYDLGRQHGAAQAVCPHIVSTDEGTSYCRLAEQGAAPVTPMDEPHPASPKAQPGGLVERVRRVIGDDAPCSHSNARAAIREVAAWLRENDSECQMGGDAAATAELLEQEAGQ
jgi:hypothetical protein